MNKKIYNVHGGNYKQYCQKRGMDWYNVTDYSTSINWSAQKFYPENLLYLHYENIEYPDPAYPELYDIISCTYDINNKDFIITNGANEAISILYQFMLVEKFFDQKSILFVGPVYSEYTKYANIFDIDYTYISFSELINDSNSIKQKIIIIVNPNTPSGEYYEVLESVNNLCRKDNIVILDESFIDFLDVVSCLRILKDYPNLFIVKSFTKFYGSAGARLGMIANSNQDYKNLLKAITPCWNISAYDNWFYINMIRKYKEIKSSTQLWMSTIHDQILNVIKNDSILKIIDSLNMHYCSLELSPERIDLCKTSLKDFFLENYKIYVRPINDFYGFSNYSFRVGLRLPDENIPVLRAIKDLQ